MSVYKLSYDEQMCSNVLQQNNGLQVNTATNCTLYTQQDVVAINKDKVVVQPEVIHLTD